MTAVQFLRNVIAALPYKIHTLLTDNGAQFTHRKQDKPASMRLFDRVCHEHDIEHRMRKSLKGGIKNLNGLLLTLFSTLRNYTSSV